MVAFQHLLRRHCTTISHFDFSFLLRRSPGDLGFHSPSSFLGFQRLFSSSSDSPPNEYFNKTPPQPSSIKPVSYSTKPKEVEEPILDKSPPTEPPQTTPSPPITQSEQAANAEARAWTREDIRYVKDVPSISPVSYPSRGASLPEDKAHDSTQEDQKEETARDNVLLDRERRRIDTDAIIRSTRRTEDEKVLPFPTLIKIEKKKPKSVIDLQDAIRQVKANAKANFDETIEAHVNLSVDPRRTEQMVRGATTLPRGHGKSVRIAVIAEGAAAEEARAAGADVIGGNKLIEEIQIRKRLRKLSFDRCISTPDIMPRVRKLGKILGPRGLMPNPKLGSVTSDVSGAVREVRHGRIEFKNDKTAIVHVGLGKASFTEESLRENVGAFVNALLLAKPEGLKKTSKYAGYVNSFSLSSTMGGPAFRVSIQSLSKAADHYNKFALK